MTTSSSSHEVLARKQAFYADLKAMLDDNDEEPDPGRRACEAMLRSRSRIPATVTAEQSSNEVQRSAASTNLGAHKPKGIADQPGQAGNTTTAAPTLEVGAMFVAPSSDAVVSIVASGAIPRCRGAAKRKRNGTVNLVADAQQIFKGLHFYFFPNDDNNPARAMRIMKALEYGATWQKTWSEHVTHVVVDKQHEYKTVLKLLKVSELPEAVIVVSENYPADCISFRLLMDAKQKRFQVKGYTQSRLPTSIEMAGPEPKSLELKPAGRSVMARSPESERATDEAQSSAPRQQPSQERAAVPVIESLDHKAVPRSTVDSTAELDQAIRQAKVLQSLPLDEDGEDSSRPTSSEGPATDDEDHAPNAKKSRTKRLSFQDKFQCMQKHTGDKPNNPNAATITILQQMADYYGQVGDQWRIRAYRKAIATLRNHPTKVWTKTEALALPQIGERLASKIEEIAYTNRVRRLDHAKAEPGDQVLQTFMGVYGAGFDTASEWVAQGYRTLDEVLQRADLTENQRIGIEHYEDFNSRLPRREVEQHGNIVRQALLRLDPTFELIIGGSYRRGSTTSGDIDCIITRPNSTAAHLRAVVLDQLIPALFKSGFLVAGLATTSRDDGSKWHGASCLPDSQIWRRIDLLLVPSDELGAALIYFTGNDIFNRSLRLLASTKGMRLNQRGLFKDAMRDRGRENISDGVKIEGRDEKRIFEVLGVPWRPAEHRIC